MLTALTAKIPPTQLEASPSPGDVVYWVGGAGTVLKVLPSPGKMIGSKDRGMIRVGTDENPVLLVLAGAKMKTVLLSEITRFNRTDGEDWIRNDYGVACGGGFISHTKKCSPEKARLTVRRSREQTALKARAAKRLAAQTKAAGRGKVNYTKGQIKAEIANEKGLRRGAAILPKPSNKAAEAKPKPKETEKLGPSAERIAEITKSIADNKGKTLGFEELDKFTTRILEGDVTADEVRANWERFKQPESQAAIVESLGKLKKADLQKLQRGWARSGDKKSDLVERVRSDLAMDFLAPGEGGISYGGSMFAGKEAIEKSKIEAIDKKMGGWTDEAIQKDAANRRERRAKFKKSIENPETKEEFDTYLQYRKVETLSPEKRRLYDDLFAGAKRDLRKAQEEAAAKIRATDVKGNDGKERKASDIFAEIQTTVHAKKGHDLHVVAMQGERLEREEFNKLKDRAKKFGGYYSSYRGKGAIPGFQFTDPELAKKFRELDEVEGTEQLEAKNTNRLVKTSDRLRDLAANMEARAEETLTADRQMNTARRVRMGEGIMDRAREDQRFAETLRNVAGAADSGGLKFLDQVSSRRDLEQLESILGQGQYKHAREEGDKEKGSYQGASMTSAYQRIMGGAPGDEAIDRVDYPYPAIHPDRLYRLALANKNTTGMRRLSADMEKIALKQLQENEADNGKPFSSVNFRNSRYIDKLQEFHDKAKNAASRKGLKDFDDGGKWNVEQIGEALADYKRLQKMGITDAPTLRAALREYVPLRAGAKDETADEKAARLERSLVGSRPGVDYFPTPSKTGERMADEIQIKKGDRVLEPSAGSGRLADVARKRGAVVDTIEMSSELRQVLEAKGYKPESGDFLQVEPKAEYDKVIMNPPFGGRSSADVDHVKHAYKFLKPGGSLSAVMSEGPFFRDNAKDREFRRWLEDNGGVSEQLPEGTFQESGTGVNTRLVKITKPGEARRKSRAEIDNPEKYAANIEAGRAARANRTGIFSPDPIEAATPERLKLYEDVAAGKLSRVQFAKRRGFKDSSIRELIKSPDAGNPDISFPTSESGGTVRLSAWEKTALREYNELRNGNLKPVKSELFEEEGAKSIPAPSNALPTPAGTRRVGRGTKAAKPIQVSRSAIGQGLASDKDGQIADGVKRVNGVVVATKTPADGSIGGPEWRAYGQYGSYSTQAKAIAEVASLSRNGGANDYVVRKEGNGWGIQRRARGLNAYRENNILAEKASEREAMEKKEAVEKDYRSKYDDLVSERFALHRAYEVDLASSKKGDPVVRFNAKTGQYEATRIKSVRPTQGTLMLEDGGEVRATSIFNGRADLDRLNAMERANKALAEEGEKAGVKGNYIGPRRAWEREKQSERNQVLRAATPYAGAKFDPVSGAISAMRTLASRDFAGIASYLRDDLAKMKIDGDYAANPTSAKELGRVAKQLETWAKKPDSIPGRVYELLEEKEARTDSAAACSEEHGWSGTKGKCKRRTRMKSAIKKLKAKRLPAPSNALPSRSSLVHGAEHLGSNVLAWKAGKITGGALTAFAVKHGFDPGSTQLMAETAMQAIAATAISLAKPENRHPRKVSAAFVTEAAAAFVGKSAHGGVDTGMESIAASERTRMISAMLAGKLSGLGAAVGVQNTGASKAVADLIVDHGRTIGRRILAEMPSTYDPARRADGADTPEAFMAAVLDLTAIAFILAQEQGAFREVF